MPFHTAASRRRTKSRPIPIIRSRLSLRRAMVKARATRNRIRRRKALPFLRRLRR